MIQRETSRDPRTRRPNQMLASASAMIAVGCSPRHFMPETQVRVIAVLSPLSSKYYNTLLLLLTWSLQNGTLVEDLQHY